MHDKLLLHLPMNQKPPIDVSKYNRTCSVLGSGNQITIQTGIRDKSLYFPATSTVSKGNAEYIQIPNSDDWYPQTMTIACWCYVSGITTNSQCVVLMKHYGNNQPYYCWFLAFHRASNGNYSAWGSYGCGTNFWYAYESSPPQNRYNLNEWFHLALVVRNNEIAIYINGNKILSNSPRPTGNIPVSTHPVHIGYNIYSSLQDNLQQTRLDDLRFYSFDVNETDLKRIMLGLQPLGR